MLNDLPADCSQSVSPLAWAALNGSVKVTSALLAAKADAGQVFGEGMTALHYAAKSVRAPCDALSPRRAHTRAPHGR